MNGDVHVKAGAPSPPERPDRKGQADYDAALANRPVRDALEAVEDVFEGYGE